MLLPVCRHDQGPVSMSSDTSDGNDIRKPSNTSNSEAPPKTAMQRTLSLKLPRDYDAVHGGHRTPAERLQIELSGGVDLEESENQSSSLQGMSRKVVPMLPEGQPRSLNIRKKGPLEVIVGYKINSLGDVDSIAACFEVDFKIFIHWNDPAFVGKEKGPVKKGSSKLDPKVECMNARKLVTYSEECALKNPSTGALKHSMYCRGTMSMLAMDLYMFPFDCQNLQIGVKPNKKDIHDVVLIAGGECSINSFPRNEWQCHGHICRSYHTDPTNSSTGKIYSSLHIILLMERESGWYVKNIMLPSVALVLLNYTIYAFDPDDVASRMEIAVGLVLATAVNKIVVSDKLAKVPYQTFIDRFQSACFYYQLFIGIQMPAISISTNFEKGVGQWVNMILFLSSFIFFFVMCYFYMIKLRKHLESIDKWKDLATDQNIHTRVQPRRSHHRNTEVIGLFLSGSPKEARRSKLTRSRQKNSFDDRTGEDQNSFVHQLEKFERAENQANLMLQQQRAVEEAKHSETMRIKKRVTHKVSLVANLLGWGKSKQMQPKNETTGMRNQFEIRGLSQSHEVESSRTRGIDSSGNIQDSTSGSDNPPLPVGITGPKTGLSYGARTIRLQTWAVVYCEGSDDLEASAPPREVYVTMTVNRCKVELPQTVLRSTDGGLRMAKHVITVPSDLKQDMLTGRATFSCDNAMQTVPFVIAVRQSEDMDASGDPEIAIEQVMLGEADGFSSNLTHDLRKLMGLSSVEDEPEPNLSRFTGSTREDASSDDDHEEEEEEEGE